MAKSRSRSIWAAFWGACLAWGCATHQVKIETDVPATVSYVPWTDLAGAGDELGKTPVTIDLKTAQGRVVRIDAKGKTPFLWTHSSSTVGESVTASFRLPDLSPVQATGQINFAEANKTQRLIIRAYRALTSKDFAMAKNLAEQAKALAPYMSMPHVIVGAAELESGSKEAARLAFAKAKALDPEDADVDALIKMVSP